MKEETQQTKSGRLTWLIEQGEAAYEAMYNAPSFSAASGCYSNAKDFLHDAIALATELGEVDLAISLGRRLEHIKAIFRSQFSA